jgi:glycogen debranching enzyme
MKVALTTCQNFEQALGLEWLETNGRGGFSSGTVGGANTRRYHALLLTARKPPSERFVLVNHLEEWIDIEGPSYPLSTNLYPNAIHPEGYKQCTGFTTDPWPTWTYDCHGTVVQREVFCVRDRDLVVIRWTLAGKTALRTFLSKPCRSILYLGEPGDPSETSHTNQPQPEAIWLLGHTTGPGSLVIHS